MNKDEMTAQIRGSWEIAKHMGLGQVFSGPVALVPSDSFKSKASDPETTYEQLYLDGLRDSQYNILLNDFAYLQFGFGKVDGVRYAYYPNPFLGASEAAVNELSELQEYVTEGVMGVDEFLAHIAELRNDQHPPLVRYEYSISQYVEESHPTSHLHLGYHGENRWPLSRFLGVTAFSLLMFRIFYLPFWLGAPTIKRGENEQTLDEVLAHIRQQSCRILPDAEFSEAEKKRFHFQ